jgi:asparagine synthetase B (glutamine-hydrolysing)
MRTENRNTILFLNGKIQNRQEPRWELEQALYTFNCRSGTEVVLRVFRAWDVKSLGRKQRELLPALKGLRGSNAACCCAYVGLQEREHTLKSQYRPRVALLVE